MIRTLLLAAGLSLALAAPASAATFVVAPNSTREQLPCTPDFPCALAYASDQSGSGDEILLSAGSYPLTGNLAVKAGVHLRGHPARAAIEANSWTVSLLPSAPAAPARLSRVDVRGGGVSVWGGGIVEDVSVVRGGDYRPAITLGGGHGVVRNVLARAEGLSGHAVIGRSIDQAAPPRLINVTAVATGQNSAGILAESDASTFDGGVTCTYSHARLVLTNTIGRGVETDAAAWKVGDPACSAAIAELVVDHSNLRGYQGDVTLGAGNQLGIAAPVFADAGSFHQRPDSPTVDAGTATAFVTGADLDGDARLLGPAPDIGADEIPAAPTAGTPAVSAITQTTATLSGSFGAGSRPTTGVFDWGPTAAFGSVAGETGTAGPLGATLTGLQPGTTYHVRVRAFSGDPQGREAVSPTVTFTTLAAEAGGSGGGDPVGLSVPASIRKRKLLRRGLRVSFNVPVAGSAYKATLTGTRGKKRLRLAARGATGSPAGATITRLKGRKRAVRRLGRVTRARLVLRITEPGGSVLVRSAQVTVKR